MFDYTAFCDQFDLTTCEGISDFLQAALSGWRDCDINDEQFDDLVARAISTIHYVDKPVVERS